MRQCLNPNKSVYPFILVIGLFFILISPKFFTDGMFLDGVWYATLSKNLADGFSSIWVPRLTETQYAWGQPPLAMILESPFFMLGNSLYLAKIYSVLTYICTGCIMYLVWRELGGKNNFFWIVLLVWIVVPTVFWAATENVLENTMSIFVMLSVLMYLKSIRTHRILYVLMSGIMLTLAFLTKGFTGLYPLAFPLIYWIFIRKETLLYSVADTMLMFAALVLPILVLWFFSPGANSFLKTYVEVQVLGSMEHAQIVDHHYAIVISFFREILLSLAVVLVVVIVAVKQKVMSESMKNMDFRLSSALGVLALSGVVPMMVSLIQRDFYIITVFPIFALAVGVAMEPVLENISLSRTFSCWVKIISLVMLVTAVAVNVFFAGKAGRDKDLLEDVYLISAEIPESTVIGASKGMYEKWSMTGYFYFLNKTSLDYKEGYDYYLCDQTETPKDSTYAICVKGVDLQLFKKP